MLLDLLMPGGTTISKIRGFWNPAGIIAAGGN